MLEAFSILTVTSITWVGLLAIWAGASRRHWFLRAGVFVGVLSLLLLIPAYEPFVAFTLQGAVVAVGVKLYRCGVPLPACLAVRRKDKAYTAGRASSGTRRFALRYSILTLLQLTVFLAISMAVAAKLPVLNVRAWQSVVLIGLVFGSATLLGLWIVHGRLLRWWWRIALGVPLAIWLSLPLVWGDWLLLTFQGTYPWPPPEPGALLFAGMYGGYGEDDYITIWIPMVASTIGITSIVLWLLAGVVAIGSTAAGQPSRANRSAWKKIAACTVLLPLAAMLTVPPAYIYYRLMTPLPIPETVLPNPNGYDDLIAAGKLAEKWKFNNTTYGPEEAPLDELSAAVKEMQTAYERLEIGLNRPVKVPVEYSSEDLSWTISIQSIRCLARALQGRGYLAKLEGRPDDAEKSFLDTVRLGYFCRRGGLVVDALVGAAISGIGQGGLYKLRGELTSKQCAELIRVLDKLEEQAEPCEDIIYRDRVYDQHATGWHGHLNLILWNIADETSYSPDAFRSAFAREQAMSRLLRTELAIQLWRATHSTLPETLDDLVSDYLPEVPVDPFDPKGNLLRYRRTNDSYLLYSVGFDNTDDGGTPPDNEEDLWGYYTKGDLRLDVLWAPEPEADENDEP